MARSNQIRLSDGEKQSVEQAAEVLYSEREREEIPMGLVIGECAEYIIENHPDSTWPDAKDD